MNKNIFLLTVLLFTANHFSYSQTSTKAQAEKSYLKILDLSKLFEIGKSIKPSVEKYNFYQHLYYAYNYDMLKNAIDPEINQIKKYPENIIKEVARIVVPEYKIKISEKELDESDGESSLRVKMQSLDSSLEVNDSETYSKLKDFINGSPFMETFVEKVTGEFVTVNRNAGTGASLVFQYLYYKNGKLTNLGTVYSYLNKAEFKSLEQTIKSKVSKYDYPSLRGGTDIVKMKNGNYKVSFFAYKENDLGCCPSIAVSYETKDFKTIIPNSITAK